MVEEMTFQDVQSELLALKKLYLLLQRSLLRRNSTDSYYLDEKAQMLLKDLLDFAVGRIFGALTKIIAAKTKGEDLSISAQLVNTTSESQSLVLPTLPGTDPRILENQNSNRDFSFLATTGKKDELLPLNSASQRLASGPFSIGISSGNIRTRKRLCRACTRNREKQLTWDINPSPSVNRPPVQLFDLEKVDFQNATTEGNRGLEKHPERKRYRETEQHTSASNFSPLASRKKSAAVGFMNVVRPLDEGSDFVNEVGQTINEIEAGILALQQSSPSIKPLKNLDGQQNRTNGAKGEVSSLRGAGGWDQLDPPGRYSVKDVTSLKKSPALIQNRKAIVAKPDSMNQLASDNAQMSSSATNLMTRGLWMPSHRADGYTAAQRRTQKRVTNEESPSTMKIPTSRPWILPDSVSSANKATGEINLSYHRDRPLKKIPAECRRHTSSRISRMYESESGDCGSGESSRIPRKIPLQRRWKKKKQLTPSVSENSGSSSRYFSSSWSSRQASTCSSNSASYSSPSSREYSADVDSSAGSCDRSSSYSISSHLGQVNPPRKWDRRREFQLSVQANHEKAVGRLRRVKNKLGLIFHHHHHHHHHHHMPDPNLKPIGNMLHGKDGREIGKRANKGNGLRKSRNDQVGHFHALVQGLLRHIWQSKKPRPIPKGKVLRNHGAKKLYWWQTLRRPRGGVKLPNRGRARLKLAGKRPQIKTPKIR